jgi:PAS domain S-box-containing protein
VDGSEQPRRFDIGTPISATLSLRWFQAIYENPLIFSGILDQNGVVLDANHVSVEGCGLVRAEVLGRSFWECGWWNRDAQLSERVQAWCIQVSQSHEAFRTQTPYFLGDGSPRMVDLALYPVFADDGDMTYVVATGSDITDAVTERRADDRLRHLVGVALELATAETVEDLTNMVVDRALPVLGVDGGAIAVRTDADRVQMVISSRLGRRSEMDYDDMPLSSLLPAITAARTGRRILLPTRASGLLFTAEMDQVYAATSRLAWASFPLRSGSRLVGSLTAAWIEERAFSDEDVNLLEAFAAQCTAALDRIRNLEAERRSITATQRMSEALQRSLLTQPPTPGTLDIAVRYRAATQEAQVGGDWYDAFVAADGATLLTVGDVSGHDRVAAAAMGQVRNILRGLSFDSSDGPAEVLARLDRALAGLRVNAVASAVLVRIEPSADPQGTGRTVRWSNAGHPPPLLRLADGRVRVLDDTHDLLLGVLPAIRRTENTAELPVGATLLLYTDGLVEGRATDIDTGIRRIIELFASQGDQPTEQLCDTLLASAAGNEDDVALLVLRNKTLD